MTDVNLPQAAIPPVADSAPRLSLIVQKGPTVGAVVPCRRVVTLLGSREGCKLVLNHRRVSPVHLVLVNDGATVKAVDTLTTAGTKLNGLNLQLETLNDGDLIAVDQWEFRVQIEKPENNGHADVHPFELEPTPHVVALEHLESGRLLQPHRDVCLIGRRNGCDIVLPDARVSRAHALMVTYFGYPAIIDLLTANQTFVNDQPVRFQTLKDGDAITIGDTKFRARLLGSRVGEHSSGNGKSKKSDPAVRLMTEPVTGDLIDIEKTEGSQRWRMAEKHEKIEKTARRA